MYESHAAIGIACMVAGILIGFKICQAGIKNKKVVVQSSLDE